MNKINLNLQAVELPQAWRSSVVGKAADATIKVLRMDGSAYPDEVHPFDEALLVLEGQMNLDIRGQVIKVVAGELIIVPAGQPHAVAPGSHGTLVIVDK